MLRKFFLAVVLLWFFPCLANAWTIAAKIGSPSGSISWGNQTVTSGTGYFTISNSIASTTVTVQPAPGYKVSQVTLDNVNVTHLGSNVYTVNYGNKASHSFNVYFSPATYTVSLGAVSGGIMYAQMVAPTIGSVSQKGLTNVPSGATVEITASPNDGSEVTYLASISAAGTEPIFTGRSATPIKHRFTVDKDISFSALFNLVSQVTARISVSSQLTAVNGQVVLDASSSSTNDPPLTFSYHVSYGDPGKVTFTPITPGMSAAVTFQSSAAGDYMVTVTATSAHGASAVATTSTISVLPPGAFDSVSCTACHGGRDTEITTAYLASSHANGAEAVSCSSCHNPTATLPHPYDTAPTGACRECHTALPVTAPGHQSLVGSSACAGCHEPHRTAASRFSGPPHFNSITSAGYPASYVTSRGACANCHSSANDSAALDAIRRSWAGSGHGATQDAAWRGMDFKTLDGCVRCHTRSGFIAYSSAAALAAWGAASDKTKEVLACNGCHKADFTLRSLARYSSASAFSFRVGPLDTVSVPYRNLDYGPSNVCIACHGGTTSGEVIKRAFAFAGFTAAGRLLNHFMVAGGVLDNSVGYEFDGTPRGRDLDFNRQNTWHSGIGIPSAYDTGTRGPCVTCHMSAPGDGHSFAAVFKNRSGAIVAVAAPTVCAKCHPSLLGGGDPVSVEGLAGERSRYQSALAALRAALRYKGLDPESAGTAISWGGTPYQRANNVGAYYNYLLLKKSDAAAYVHNPTYTKRLILYSIDWLDNELFDDSDYGAIEGMDLPPGTKEGALFYLGLGLPGETPNCFSCHRSYYN